MKKMLDPKFYDGFIKLAIWILDVISTVVGTKMSIIVFIAKNKNLNDLLVGIPYVESLMIRYMETNNLLEHVH